MEFTIDASGKLTGTCFYLRGTYAATYAEQVSLTRGHDQKLAGSRHLTYAATFFTYAVCFECDGHTSRILITAMETY